jgi:hypothetical protein
MICIINIEDNHNVYNQVDGEEDHQSIMIEEDNQSINQSL